MDERYGEPLLINMKNKKLFLKPEIVFLKKNGATDGA